MGVIANASVVVTVCAVACGGAPGADAPPLEPSSLDARTDLRANWPAASERGGPAAALGPGRSGGALALDEALRLEFASLGFGTGSASTGDPFIAATFDGAGTGDAVRRSLDMVDLVLAWDVVRLGEESPLTLSVLGGLRAMHYGAWVNEPDAIERRQDRALGAAALAGMRAAWEFTPGVALGAGGAARPGAFGRDRFDYSADVAFELSDRASLSLGLERLAGEVRSSDLSAELRRSVIFARVSIRF